MMKYQNLPNLLFVASMCTYCIFIDLVTKIRHKSHSSKLLSNLISIHQEQYKKKCLETLNLGKKECLETLRPLCLNNQNFIELVFVYMYEFTFAITNPDISITIKTFYN